jgi:hypothetical protein
MSKRLENRDSLHQRFDRWLGAAPKGSVTLSIVENYLPRGKKQVRNEEEGTEPSSLVIAGGFSDLTLTPLFKEFRRNIAAEGSN